MLIIDNLTYSHQDKTCLFENISFSLATHEKAALIGNNGSGKSTLLRLVAQECDPFLGRIHVEETPYYVPQLIDTFQDLTIAEALRVAPKLEAFYAILAGDASTENLLQLDDDWSIEDRCLQALAFWDIQPVDLFAPMSILSGGQKVKVFLAGIQIHQSKLVLLDEPSNHLDDNSRNKLYRFIKEYDGTLLVVSHDRTLLNLLDHIYELNKSKIIYYNGNYNFYLEQKQIAKESLLHAIQSGEKALKKAKDKARETAERQQRMDSRGKKKQEKAGVARIMMNTLRNNSENSSAKLKDVHAHKISGLSQDLTELRSSRSAIDRMKFDFQNSQLHDGKVLFVLQGVNIDYSGKMLWKQHVNIQICSGERLAVQGKNGIGKTTFLRLILGLLEPTTGTVSRQTQAVVYIDQDYSLLDNALSIYEQVQSVNSSGLEEHEVKIRLDRFLFGNESWNKKCASLSGGERMRLALCCLLMLEKSPEVIILDEPTNNLDLQNIEILTSALREYEGTLLAVSHDSTFLHGILVDDYIILD
ncbi:ribosomal protection-like ABC-F family protein [Sphingobacterium sp. LRF_L2]|uniref:ribosomal protection-like ABC-F family protein n=1 Tax=Sphingobacterium sp. LRF_L2 TaxID=3369421 RepID=UPI003F5ED60A